MPMEGREQLKQSRKLMKRSNLRSGRGRRRTLRRSMESKETTSLVDSLSPLREFCADHRLSSQTPFAELPFEYDPYQSKGNDTLHEVSQACESPFADLLANPPSRQIHCGVWGKHVFEIVLQEIQRAGGQAGLDEFDRRSVPTFFSLHRSSVSLTLPVRTGSNHNHRIRIFDAFGRNQFRKPRSQMEIPIETFAR